MGPRPLHALVLVAALVVAACGDDGVTDGGRDDGSSGLGAGATTSSTAAPEANADPATPSTSPSRAPTTTAAGARRPAPGSAAPSTTGPPAIVPESAPGSGDVQPTPTDDGSQGPPGAFARTLLRPQPATAIVVDRAAQRGATVAEAALGRSVGVVAEVTGKPVDLRPNAVLASDETDWTAAEIRLAADAATKVPQGSGKAVLRLLLLRGTFDGSRDVLGVAVRGDVLALFTDNIAGAATPLVSRGAIEDAVLLHEVGHVLGLVDLARDTGRADKEHPGHSSNSGSVMYWAVESSLVGQVLNGPPPRDFDAQDRADLRALRDGA